MILFEVRSTVKSFSVTKFAQQIVETIIHESEVHSICDSGVQKMIVYLDSKIYPNDFGISVRPLQVKCGSKVIDMKQLIDLFGKVPYITMK